MIIIIIINNKNDNDRCYKVRWIYYKLRQLFLSQSVTRFITNCLRCNRVRQYTLTKHLSDTAD